MPKQRSKFSKSPKQEQVELEALRRRIHRLEEIAGLRPKPIKRSVYADRGFRTL